MSGAPSTFRGWIVDLDGTLYRPGPLKLLMLAELALLGAWHARVLREFRKQHELVRADAGAEQSPFEAQLERTAERTHSTKERVAGVVEEWMFDRPGKWIRRLRREDLVAEIRAFRAGGGRTALVSDYPARKKLVALELSDLFEVVIANGESNAVRTLKPNPGAFLHAASELGLAPAECLVIGDRADADGIAADRAGMGFRLVR
jgi:putative hydrolase of the HAD superfamily